jgi:hypothetical protein
MQDFHRAFQLIVDLATMRERHQSEWVAIRRESISAAASGNLVKIDHFRCKWINSERPPPLLSHAESANSNASGGALTFFLNWGTEKHFKIAVVVTARRRKLFHQGKSRIPRQGRFSWYRKRDGTVAYPGHAWRWSARTPHSTIDQRPGVVRLGVSAA